MESWQILEALEILLVAGAFVSTVWIVARAWAVRRSRAATPPEVARVAEAMERLSERVDRIRDGVDELAERLDFNERMLAQLAERKQNIRRLPAD